MDLTPTLIGTTSNRISGMVAGSDVLAWVELHADYSRSVETWKRSTGTRTTLTAITRVRGYGELAIANDELYIPTFEGLDRRALDTGALIARYPLPMTRSGSACSTV